jgi:hypothetical protein
LPHLSYEEILEEVRHLDRAQQLSLLEELASLALRSSEDAGRDRSVLELQGLGKEVWHGIDAQEYVDSERASWGG